MYYIHTCITHVRVGHVHTHVLYVYVHVLLLSINLMSIYDIFDHANYSNGFIWF